LCCEARLVRLPQRTAVNHIPSGPLRFTVRQRVTPRILVVEDSSDIASSLRTLFEAEGYECHIAATGETALSLALTLQPDVVLMDIGLPDMSGYDVARQIRRQHRFRRMLQIAVTGWGSKIDRERSLAAGIDHHLVKPVDFALISQIVREWTSSMA
jgi:CheY-like chemotaxis protein